VADFSHTVADGPLLVAAGVAALVGVIGFLSPCVLPLVPGYLAYVSGLSGSDDRRPGRHIAGAVLFVLGFTAVFVSGGILFGHFGVLLRVHEVAVNRVFGVITILFGLVFIGRLSVLQREFKIHRLPPVGLLGAPLLGAAFGFSWGPCLTPTFGTVYFMSQSSGSAGRGAFLSFCYCLGIGIPFILFACGFGWAARSATFFRRHARAVSVLGGTLLVAMGLLLVTNQWQTGMDQLRAHVGATGFNI
jgi:cytochrome c-type biogenesis protein